MEKSFREDGEKHARAVAAARIQLVEYAPRARLLLHSRVNGAETRTFHRTIVYGSVTACLASQGQEHLRMNVRIPSSRSNNFRNKTDNFRNSCVNNN